MIIGHWILFSEITILPKKIENWGEVWLSIQVILHNSPFESKKLLLCLISLPFYQIPLGFSLQWGFCGVELAEEAETLW